MPSNVFAVAARLSDLDLLRRTAELAAKERRATLDLVAHLAEVDARKLYREQGYGSLFSYCTEALKLSEHATFNRIEAARAIRAFPVIAGLIADGALNLSSVRLLAPHLTAENHADVLAQASGLSKREVEVLVARLAPRPDVPATIRKLPESRVLASRVGLPECPSVPADAAPSVFTSTPLTLHKSAIAPLAPERYRIQFTVSRETQEALRCAQVLLRREIPDGDLGAIFERALALLLADVLRTKAAVASNPRPAGSRSGRSRHVPAEVRRQVWLRDHGQCAFVSLSGRRCRERTFLEFHNVEAFALGGPTTVENLSLRRREHNAYEAKLAFGSPDAAVCEGRRAIQPGVASLTQGAATCAQLAPGRVG